MFHQLTIAISGDWLIFSKCHTKRECWVFDSSPRIIKFIIISAAAYKLRWNILLVSMIWWTSASPNGNVHPFPTNISISYLGLHLSITLIDNILFLFFNLQSVFNFSTKHFSYNFQTLFSFFFFGRQQLFSCKNWLTT